MSTARRITVGIFFGGRSVEHDVSIVTAQQIMQALDAQRYEVIPVYISREGKWFTGDVLRKIENFKEDRILSAPGLKSVILSPDVRHHGLIVDPLAGRWKQSQIQRLDVAFPAIHGTHGEDGTLQGLFELADIPYVGFATLGSALTNDKIMTKILLRAQGLPVLDMVDFSRAEWLADPERILAQIAQAFVFPVFVKPAVLGSSIGVNRVQDAAMLRTAIDVAINFDRRVLVEPAFMGGVEINCAVMGYGTELRASVLEQPLSWTDFLAFEDKYLRGGEGMKSADRIIPAPLSAELTARIQQMALDAFRAVDGRGIVRIDFLVRPDDGEVIVNELNTLPGSLAFYLWQESGLQPGPLVDHLIGLAREAHADKRRNLYDYRTNLINVAAVRGAKGMKGAKALRTTSGS